MPLGDDEVAATTAHRPAHSPLLFSSLTPYVIVGVFLASIIVLSWLATVVALPALVGGRRSKDIPAADDVSRDPGEQTVQRELQPV